MRQQKYVPSVKVLRDRSWCFMDTSRASSWLSPASCDHSCNYDFVSHQNFYLWKHKAVLFLIPVAAFLKESKPTLSLLQLLLAPHTDAHRQATATSCSDYQNDYNHWWLSARSWEIWRAYLLGSLRQETFHTMGLVYIWTRNYSLGSSQCIVKCWIRRTGLTIRLLGILFGSRLLAYMR